MVATINQSYALNRRDQSDPPSWLITPQPVTLRWVYRDMLGFFLIDLRNVVRIILPSTIPRDVEDLNWPLNSIWLMKEQWTQLTYAHEHYNSTMNTFEKVMVLDPSPWSRDSVVFTRFRIHNELIHNRLRWNITIKESYAKRENKRVGENKRNEMS